MPTTRFRFATWFVEHWPATTLPLAACLLLLSPWVYLAGGWLLWLVLLQMPIYMVHQYEEHAQNAFSRYVNKRLGNGLELLTPRGVFWVNILGVWVVDLIALYFAGFVAIGWGLLAVYLTLFNLLIHSAVAVGRREYNPGLWTSLILFAPLGGWAWQQLTFPGGATIVQHGVSLAVVVAGHGVIVLCILVRRARLLAEDVAR